MDHNPFISRNNDLFIMIISGGAIVFFTNTLFQMSVQHQFLVSLSFAFLAGIFMSYLYQSLEWALFFALGAQLVGALPLIFRIFRGDSVPLIEWVRTGMLTGQHSLFLLSSWIIAIPCGFMVQKLIMENYYRRNTL